MRIRGLGTPIYKANEDIARSSRQGDLYYFHTTEVIKSHLHWSKKLLNRGKTLKRNRPGFSRASVKMLLVYRVCC